MATRRRSRIPGDVEERIEELIEEGWTASQIHRKLTEEFPPNKAPVLRTVQRIVKDHSDPSGPWSVKDATGEEARLLLPVLGNLIAATNGRRRSFTRKEAEWVLRLVQAVPDISPGIAWTLAREYIWRENAGETTEEMDALLTTEINWESAEFAARLTAAIEQAWPDKDAKIASLERRIGYMREWAGDSQKLADDTQDEQGKQQED